MQILIAAGMNAENIEAFTDVLMPSWTGEPNEADLLRVGYQAPFKILADGRICAIMQMVGIDVLCVDINPWGHNDCYYYRANGDAAIALDVWTGESEPGGWFRHPPTGRRRIGGDPDREYLQP
jgi:hypothetical protein